MVSCESLMTAMEANKDNYMITYYLMIHSLTVRDEHFENTYKMLMT
jgi:hypothetical protein